MKKIIYLGILTLSISLTSCKTNGIAILNIDNTAVAPPLKEKHYILTKKATDKKYGYTENLPINLGFANKLKAVDATYYLNALQGPNQQTISYKKMESCCPFITKSGEMGTGLLDKYEITWEGQKKSIYLYINIYEKGELLIPVGLTAKP